MSLDDVEVIIDGLLQRTDLELLFFEGSQVLEQVVDLGLLEELGLSDVAVIPLEAVLTTPRFGMAA